MSIDWPAFLDGLYDGVGIAATLDCGTAGTFDLTVKDDTAGALLERSHGLSFATSKPAVCVRVQELLDKGFSVGTVREDIVDAALTFNSGTWKIQSTQPKPKPSGPGELYLFLQDP